MPIFDPALPTQRDELRFRIGETSDDSLIANETLDTLLARNSFLTACALACEALAAVYAKKYQKFTEGETTEDYSHRVEELERMAGRFRTQAQVEGLGQNPDGSYAGIAQMSQPDFTTYRNT